MSQSPGVQRTAAENPRQSSGDRNEHPREALLLLSPGSKPQKIFESIRAAGKSMPVISAGVEGLDGGSGKESGGLGHHAPAIRERQLRTASRADTVGGGGLSSASSNVACHAPRAPWSVMLARSARPFARPTPLQML